MMKSFTLPAIPGELHWRNQPLAWKAGPGNDLTITAGAGTDWFVDPGGTYAKDDIPSALFTPPDANFLLSARLTVEFASAFDAGALQVRFRDDLWAKLCFEYSPQQQPMIVSVVTREMSDDCNSVVMDGQEVFLRIAQTPHTTAFHYSTDGRRWHFVRYFTLGKTSNLQAGFASQSPTGQRCTVVFSDIRYSAGSLGDRRSGE
jgi:regulation of enolase protein 1 (concanavalin A-like superfamily)